MTERYSILTEYLVLDFVKREGEGERQKERVREIFSFFKYYYYFNLFFIAIFPNTPFFFSHCTAGDLVTHTCIHYFVCVCLFAFSRATPTAYGVS